MPADDEMEVGAMVSSWFKPGQYYTTYDWDQYWSGYARGAQDAHAMASNPWSDSACGTALT